MCAYKAGRWAVMRAAREAQDAVWDDAWDALAAAKAEEGEARKARVQQQEREVQAQAAQRTRAVATGAATGHLQA